MPTQAPQFIPGKGPGNPRFGTPRPPYEGFFAPRYLNVTSGGGASTPHQGGLVVGSGTIDVRCKLSADSWSAAQFRVADSSDWGNPNARWYVIVETGGVFGAAWYNAAGVLQQKDTGAVTVQSLVPDGSPIWLRALMAPSAGTHDFYWSSDGSSWTQIGSQLTGATTTGVNTTGTPPIVAIGQTSAFGGEPLIGKFYRTQVLVGGATILDMNWERVAVGGGPWNGITGEVWTALGSSTVVLASAAVFPVQCDATQAQSAACSRSVAHTSAATQAQAASQVRQAGRIVVMTQAQAAAQIRVTGRIVTTTQAQAGALTRTVNHASSTTQAQSANCAKVATRLVTCAATQAQAAAYLRVVNHSSSTTQAQSAAQSRRVNRSSAATQAQSASCAASRTVLITAAATQAQVAAQVRNVGRAVSTTQAETAAQSRRANRISAATQAQLATQSRQVNRIVATTQAQSASCAKSKATIILVAATQAQAAVVLRSPARVISATQPQAAAQTRSITQTIATTQAQAAAQSRSVGRRIATTQAQSATCAKSHAFLILIAATQAQSAVVTRNTSRSVSTTQPQAVSVAFTSTADNRVFITDWLEFSPSLTATASTPTAATFTDDPVVASFDDPEPVLA